jgi:predicted DNA-binding transcriptional regulator AlpA
MSQQDHALHPSTLHDTPSLSNRLKPSPDAKGPSPRTIERWRTTGTGPEFIKIGRRVLYRESAVEKWLDRQTLTHTNQSRERR